MRQFTRIDLMQCAGAGRNDDLQIWHLLERHGLGPKILHEVNAHLAAHGIKIARRTIVDAAITGAPRSTKSREGKRDLEMHQVMKGHEWHVGMKAHNGVDSKSKLVHSFAATPANVHDGQLLGELLHGAETRVWGTEGKPI